jgi:hypothetical protein
VLCIDFEVLVFFCLHSTGSRNVHLLPSLTSLQETKMHYCLQS